MLCKVQLNFLKYKARNKISMSNNFYYFNTLNKPKIPIFRVSIIRPCNEPSKTNKISIIKFNDFNTIILFIYTMFWIIHSCSGTFQKTLYNCS